MGYRMSVITVKLVLQYAGLLLKPAHYSQFLIFLLEKATSYHLS